MIWECFLHESSWNPPKKRYILTPYFELSWDLSAINYFQWTCDCAIYNDVRKSIFEIVQTDKLSLYYELVNIYKYGEKSSFKHFSCFLKNRGPPLKGLTFFLDFEKKGSFKEFKFSWFHCKKGYVFAKNFLKRGHLLHARTHMCTHFSYESPLVFRPDSWSKNRLSAVFGSSIIILMAIFQNKMFLTIWPK